MESTSTYGDIFRYQSLLCRFGIHQASAKRVHDTKEVYDGAPSLHDAKATSFITRFYLDGLTKSWRELNEWNDNTRAHAAIPLNYSLSDK